MGIDADLIARAAATLPVEGERARAIWGASSAYRASRRIATVAGADDHARIAAMIRDHLGGIGEVRPVGDGFEWHAGPADNKMLVAVAPAGDHTRIRVDVRQHGPKVGLYLCAGALTAFAAVAGAVASPIVGGALLVGVGATSYAAARTAWTKIAARSRRRVESLLEQIDESFDR